MGEVIRKEAAAADILADVETTLTRAAAKGPEWQAPAEERLRGVATLAALVETRLAEGRSAVDAIAATLDAANDESDRLVHRIADELWNLIGRPAIDPASDILFPGGASYYTDGAVSEQPDRMLLLAELLEAGLHPRAPAANMAAFAAELRVSATTLQTHVDAARPLHARLKLAERMHVAIARTGQNALARLKRQWKADGKTEAQIHAVIPDRPTTKKPAPGDPPPTP